MNKNQSEINKYLTKMNVNKHSSEVLIEMIVMKFDMSFYDARKAFIIFIRK